MMTVFFVYVYTQTRYVVEIILQLLSFLVGEFKIQNQKRWEKQKKFMKNSDFYAKQVLVRID